MLGHGFVNLGIPREWYGVNIIGHTDSIMKLS